MKREIVYVSLSLFLLLYFPETPQYSHRSVLLQTGDRLLRRGFAVMRSGKKDSKRTFPFSGSFIQIKINRRKMPRMESRPVSAACPTVQRPRQHIRPMFFRSRISNIKRFLSPEVRQKAFVIIRIEGKLRCGIILLSYFKEYFISSVYTGRR